MLAGAFAGALAGAAVATTAVLFRGDGASGSAPAAASDAALVAAPVAVEPAQRDAVPAVAERSDADTAIAELRSALADAEAERSQLAATVVALNREVLGLIDAVAARNLPGGPAGEGDGASAGDALADGSAGEGGGPGSARRGRDGLARDGLLAAGVDPQVVGELERRSDAWQLARLELVDRASREGWADSDELDRQLDDLEGERPDLRAELGDAAYDRYLFEAGTPNRVGIASIIAGSAADTAGFAEGDLVLGYAGQRIFTSAELQAGTRAGSRGEFVPVEIERDGQFVSLEVPRGPLGVTLQPLRREP